MNDTGTEPDIPTPRPGRNEPCHCGSGKKYKHCCLVADEEADRQAREAEQAEAPLPPPEQERPKEPAAPRHAAEQPWKRGQQNVRGFRKFTGPRKVGGG